MEVTAGPCSVFAVTLIHTWDVSVNYLRRRIFFRIPAEEKTSSYAAILFRQKLAAARRWRSNECILLRRIQEQELRHPLLQAPAKSRYGSLEEDAAVGEFERIEARAIPDANSCGLMEEK